MDKLDFYYSLPYWLQNIMLSSGKYFEDIKFKTYINIINKELEKTENYSLDELQELQREKLMKLINIAYNNVEYYRELFNKIKLKPSDIKNLNDIKKIPILSKDDIRKHYKKLINYSIPKQDLLNSHTSGTTGSPLHFLMDNYTQAYYRSHIIRHRRWHNMKVEKDWCASFGGRKILEKEKLPLWRYDFPNKLVIYSTHHMNDKNMNEFYKHIQKRNLKYIKGYTTNLYTFAEYLNENDLILNMNALFIGAEPIFDFMKPSIEKAFNNEISDFYGNSEETARAYDCKCHNGLHMAMESIFMEIDNPDNNGYGEIVGTCLTNYAMPFIRYRTGDYTKIINKNCKCDRKHTLIEGVKTRNGDRIITKSGKKYSPTMLVFPFYKLKSGSIRRSQIIQEKEGQLIIKIVKGSKFMKSDLNILENEFIRLYKEDIDVSFKFADIQIKPGKKFMWVENRINTIK